MENLNRPSVADFEKIEKTPVVLVLDNVRSALNVGSAFRTADGFGLEKIWLCGITATPPNREILKTALGSTESVAWEHTENTAFLLEKLKKEGFQVLAVEQTEPKIWLQDFLPDKKVGQKIALVFGNEVDGVSESALEVCHGSLEIPQIGTKHSLNISVALGIVVWEVFRKLRY
jgi:23S rRNA (guanosine2251-2'-O)-methyltransferase